MKTAEEKVRKWLADNNDLIFGVALDSHEHLLLPAITKLLKEQDRDTRHACMNAAASESYHDDFGHHLIYWDDAYDAIMNTKAV